MRNSMTDKFPFFLKGTTMGICDLVPGISGGTIAFITGIYERLITGIKELNIFWLLFFFKFLFTGRTSAWHKSRIHFLKTDWEFFVPLGLGIGLAIFFGAHGVSYLLTYYFVQTMSFFVGVIIVSLFYLKERVHEKTLDLFAYFVLGGSLGIVLAVLIPTQTPDSWWMFTLSGFFGIFALFLPGISGSYILLLLGKYSQIINAIKSPFSHIGILLLFAIGAVVGMYVVSRFVSYLLKIAHDKTVYLLMGVVLGSLILPIRQIIPVLESPNHGIFALVFLGIGCIIPIIVHKYHQKKHKDL